MSARDHAEVLVNLAAYRRNLETLIHAVAPSRLMAVVKSDGYGHGLLALAHVAESAGITDLGALDLETALALRAGGISEQVSVFAWLYTPQDDIAAAVAAGIDIGVSNISELKAIATAGAASPARIHLKIDTGLHRNGADEQEWPGLIAAARAAEEAGAVRITGAWTHISEASAEEDSAAIARFVSAVSVAEALGAEFEVRHLAASAAGYARPDSRFDLVRMGAFTLGISPGGGITADELGLEPVMTLQSRVERITEDHGTLLGLVPMGSGDGILSECAGRMSVAIAGHRYPISSVTLDGMSVEVDQNVAPGDTVTLFGPGAHGEPTLQEWADALGTIGEEIVVRLSPLITRRYFGR